MVQAALFMFSRIVCLALSIAFLTGVSDASADGALKFADQGAQWSALNRKEFYSLDQGARVMPLSWFKALKRFDGTGFLDDSLGRYGYLHNPDSPTPGLPVGFLAAAEHDGSQSLSITCSACHTRQIEIDGAPFRIDGGPGIVDIGSFFSDLDAAYAKLLGDDCRFRILCKLRNWRLALRGRRQQAQAGGSSLVPAVSCDHAGGLAEAARASMGAGAARCGGDDFQPCRGT